uniref:Uncharacterized protein n=1 Tax=Clastoptera arizonana TaxID=38151 RepID=A0A1B6DXX5_9HEMI
MLIGIIGRKHTKDLTLDRMKATVNKLGKKSIRVMHEAKMIIRKPTTDMNLCCQQYDRVLESEKQIMLAVLNMMNKKLYVQNETYIDLSKALKKVNNLQSIKHFCLTEEDFRLRIKNISKFLFYDVIPLKRQFQEDKILKFLR